MKKKFVCSHQYIELFIGATEKVEFTKDIVLQNEVKQILMPFPFLIEHNGTQNVYDITPARTLTELLKEVQRVMKREYDAGKCIASSALEDLCIESLMVHENDCANIDVGDYPM